MKDIKKQKLYEINDAETIKKVKKYRDKIHYFLKKILKKNF